MAITLKGIRRVKILAPFISFDIVLPSSHVTRKDKQSSSFFKGYHICHLDHWLQGSDAGQEAHSCLTTLVKMQVEIKTNKK